MDEEKIRKEAKALMDEFMAALDHLHAAIVLVDLVQKNGRGQQVGVGVREEGQVLMPGEGAFALRGRLGGELGLL